MTALELGDLQGILLFGHGQLPFASFLFLELDDRDGARAWLRALLDEITTAEKVPRERRRPVAVQLALSPTGLSRLGVSDAALATFSDEFRWGMAARARVLGDMGASAPEHWQVGRPDQTIDALLLLYATTEAVRDAWIEGHQAAMHAHGVQVAQGGRLDAPQLRLDEPFGFRDGISQPSIEGGPKAPASPQVPLKPGELVLGHVDEYGMNPLPPSVAPEDDPAGRLVERDGRRMLGDNGTYLVFRKLSQDVAGFWRHAEEASRELRASGEERNAEWLAAKMVGRARSGDPLLPGGKVRPSMTPTNDFGFARKDAAGLGCPIGSHVRRSNPRDSLPPDAPRSLTTVARHRIFRRGRGFGPPVDEQKRAVDDGADRGLYFVCLNANLRRQFEFVQQTWVVNPNFGGLQNDEDPLLGPRAVRADGDGTPVLAGDFTIPAEPFRVRVAGLPRFVETRGGGYFFVPGMRALRYLADVGGPAPKVRAQAAPRAHARSLLGSILAEGRAVAEGFEDLGDVVLEHLQEWSLKPDRLHPLFRFLRKHEPILVAPGVAVISLHDDVKEVLTRDDAFGVTRVYAERMHETTGAFFLGMEDGERYQREAGIARAAVRPEDPEVIRAIVSRNTREAIDAARAAGSVDLVQGITRRVAARTVRDFFGVPGPDEATLMRWMRTIFWEIFLDPLRIGGVREAAQTSSTEMRAYLDGLIRSRRSAPRDDYLSRLIARADAATPPLDDDGIRRNLGGIIVGAVDTTSKAAALAVATLLDRPVELARARRAARDRNDALVARYVWEALRFAPQAPLLLRHARRTTLVAAGTPREREIPEGTLVVVGTLSASFDSTRVRDPWRFRVDRETPGPDMFHFGSGLHRCFGLFVNHVQIPEIARQLLLLDRLQPAEGADGIMTFEGPFPDTMRVVLR